LSVAESFIANWQTHRDDQQKLEFDFGGGLKQFFVFSMSKISRNLKSPKIG